jgi:hypothetical protein
MYQLVVPFLRSKKATIPLFPLGLLKAILNTGHYTLTFLATLLEAVWFLPSDTAKVKGNSTQH